jgi:hypothetical protein
MIRPSNFQRLVDLSVYRDLGLSYSHIHDLQVLFSNTHLVSKHSFERSRRLMIAMYRSHLICMSLSLVICDFMLLSAVIATHSVVDSF